MISNGKDINATDEEGCTPLLTAIINGQGKIAKELILKGADPNKTNKECSTPVLSAAMRGDDEILELLLKHRAEINKGAPLVITSAEGNYYAANALIKYGADVNQLDG